MHIERILLRDIGPFDNETIQFPKGKDPNLADVYLLTGPNGSGKSTVLYALASVLACGRYPIIGTDLLPARMRSSNAIVVLQTDDQKQVAAACPRQAGRPDVDLQSVFAGGQPTPILSPTTALDYYGQDYTIPAYVTHVWTSGKEPPSLDWAAFAYAGLRSMSEVRITAVKEPASFPLDNSLSFLQTANTNLLANWIVHQNYRRLKAKEAGDLEYADQFERSVRRIERTIGEIIEDPSFGFVITTKDDDVRVRWQGVTVRLGVLPAGLQSIVSWIADLLMRLDRLPWQDNTPVEQRRFLLLLDEIDIHLHPAWQRRVLPLVQRLFPNAQIIASTHSPFVVGSLADGRIISLGLQGGSAKVVHVDEPQLGVSYSAVLRSIFGIESEFDVDTEQKLQEFHAARRRLLGGDEGARADVERIADELKQRSEELRGLMALELGQMRRQLAQRAAP